MLSTPIKRTPQKSRNMTVSGPQKLSQYNTASLSTIKKYVGTGQVKRAIGLLMKKRSRKEAIISNLGTEIGKELGKYKKRKDKKFGQKITRKNYEELIWEDALQEARESLPTVISILGKSISDAHVFAKRMSKNRDRYPFLKLL